MTNVDDFLRLRADARVFFPVLEQWALVDQAGQEISWEHFNSAGIPQYNVPLGFDVIANQATGLVAYHEPGHEYEEYLRLKDPTLAHRRRFLDLIDEPLDWAVLKAIAYSDPIMTPSQQHDLDPGEWWADAFANAVAGQSKVGPFKVQSIDPLAMRAFFQSLIASLATIDVRSQLPFVGNIYGTFTPKSSLTFHWNGGPIPEYADPLLVLKADAQHHINQGWGGISYHAAIWNDGTLYVTRDPDAVLAACGNALGNARSTHVQVMIGVGQVPTAAQRQRMDELVTNENEVFPHSFWSATACPGPQITQWIGELDMAFTEADRDMLKRVKDILEAREPLVWAARGQRFLDVERGTAYNPNLPPIDPRIKAP